MTVTGEQRVPLPADAALALLRDPDHLAQRITSVESAYVEAGVLHAVVSPQIALGAIRFDVVARVAAGETDNAVRYLVSGRRAENTMELVLDVDVRDDGAGGSLLRWQADGVFRGSLGAVGQRTLPLVAGEQIDAVFAGLAAAPD